MADNLEALTVEKLNLAVSRAVNVTFSVPDTSYKHKISNVLPGTISIPTTMPTSAPLMYNFNVNTQPPILAVPKQTSSTAMPIAGTIIPLRRPAPMVQLTPLSSCKVQPSLGSTTSIHQQLPILLPKQPQAVSVPTVQVVGAGSPATRLPSIPLVTNLASQQPQHAGTLILPGGRSVNVQTVNIGNTSRVSSEAQLAVNTSVQETTKGLYYLSPDSAGKLQLLPIAQSTVSQEQAVQNKSLCAEQVGTQQTSHYNIIRDSFEGAAVTKVVNESSTHLQAPTQEFDRSTHISTDQQQHNVQSAPILDSIGDETSNDALELSRNLDQHSNYLEDQANRVQLCFDSKLNAQTGDSSSFQGTEVEGSTSVMAEDIRALVNMVRCSNFTQHNSEEAQQTTAISEKENNLLSTALEIIRDSDEGNDRLRRTPPQSNKSPSSSAVGVQVEQVQSKNAMAEGIYCVACNATLEGQCKVHTEPIVHISDSPIQSYARASLPRILELKPSLVNKNETGVFTRGRIAVNTRFGPIIGESYSNEEFERASSSPSGFWLVFDGDGQCMHMIYNASEETANWMRFVQQAKHSNQQNLVAFQQGQDIYFITNKDVEPNTELLYWYSKDTAAFMGLYSTPEDGLKCRICLKQFSDDKHFKQHMKFKHPDMSTRKFTCHLCDKAFSSSSKLNTHMQGHAGIKPHQCNICAKTFTDKSNLRMHMSIHTGERRFICPTCNKTFRQKAHLESHAFTHTKEKSACCRFCTKTFARRSDLKQHEFLHTKETVFKCPDPKCNKEFYTKQNLKKHQRIHSGDKKYICEHCCKSFYTNYHLRRHKSTCVAKPVCR